MISRVFMPKLGQTMEEATLERWIKKEGDEVKKGDVLLEITTDKATLEVESYSAGILKKIIGKEGEVYPVNAVIAFIGGKDDVVTDRMIAEAAGAAQPPAKAPAAEKKEEPKAEPPPAPRPQGRILISPRAKKKARELGIDCSAIRGSGPGGRIVEKDILAAAETHKKIKASPLAKKIALLEGIDLRAVTGTGPGGRITKEDVLAAKAKPAAPLPGKPIEMTAMRKIVAGRLTQSHRDIPHFYAFMNFDMTRAVQLRKKLNAESEARISYNDLLIRACALSLREFSPVNALWSDDRIIFRDEVNVGLAVAIDTGLIVPVVKNADKKNIHQIAKNTGILVEKARTKKLTPDDYEGGTFTISNLGMYEVEAFTAIINPGQSAILAVGKLGDRVVAEDGGIKIKQMMTVTLSSDHRIVDGAVAASFLRNVKELMEDPEKLL